MFQPPSQEVTPSRPPAPRPFPVADMAMYTNREHEWFRRPVPMSVANRAARGSLNESGVFLMCFGFASRHPIGTFTQKGPCRQSGTGWKGKSSGVRCRPASEVLQR